MLSRILKALVRYKNSCTIRKSDIKWSWHLLLLNGRLHRLLLLLLSISDLRERTRRNRWVHAPLWWWRWRCCHHVKGWLKHRRQMIRRWHVGRCIIHCCDAMSIAAFKLLLLNLDLLMSIWVLRCADVGSIVTPNHHRLKLFKFKINVKWKNTITKIQSSITVWLLFKSIVALLGSVTVDEQLIFSLMWRRLTLAFSTWKRLVL